MAVHTIDARGLRCPQPVLKITAQAVKTPAGDVIEALGDCPTFEKDVRFDALLFDHTVASGVHALEGHRVSSVGFDEESVTLEGESGGGSRFSCRARYLVDASGRDTLLGRQLRIKHRSPRRQSAALFAHFRGVERRKGADEGNVSIYRLEQGWVWLIPLPDGIMSVGAVCWPDYLKQRRTDNREFLLQTLHSIPALRERMRHAEIVGNLHATGNYSYACSRMSGPRWIMAGDSYAFVDPVFSSGVFLGMHAAEKAADVEINTLWAAPTAPDSGKPTSLKVANVVHFAAWYPGQSSALAYSTVEPRATAPGWQANNDLIRTSLSGSTATILDPQSGGVYGWWGTSFALSFLYGRFRGEGQIDYHADH